MIDQELLNQYKEWIRERNKDFKEREDGFDIENDYGKGEINFVSLDNVVVEMKVISKKDEEDRFYLHFELRDLDYAKELFDQMVESFNGLEKEKNHKILLSCTGGLTTLFFATKLNDAAKVLNTPVEFDAVGFEQLYERAFEYDVILLAPQIKHMHDKAQEILKDKIVMDIPPKIFAEYDAGALINDTFRKLRERRRKKDREILKARGSIRNDKKILSIAIMPSSYGTRIAYRFYDKGEPVINETVIKPAMNILRDITDILDTAILREKQIDAISIQIPGIVNNGCVDLPGRIERGFNVKEYMEEKYGVKTYLANNVNAAALGYYAIQDECKNIAFLSQPRGWTIGGAGLVINGRPVIGKSGMAGETRHLNPILKEIEVKDAMHANIQETIEAITRQLIAIISIVDPELILVRSELVPDMNDLKESLEKEFKEEQIPKLIHVSEEDMSDYVLLGGMIQCIYDNKKISN
ncbi:MAG: ROK family protein [Erysipelotrichaceae bacterium]|nr:ROK family protein [Erysipelotrichaceae bacterium]